MMTFGFSAAIAARLAKTAMSAKILDSFLMVRNLPIFRQIHNRTNQPCSFAERTLLILIALTNQPYWFAERILSDRKSSDIEVGVDSAFSGFKESGGKTLELLFYGNYNYTQLI